MPERKRANFTESYLLAPAISGAVAHVGLHDLSNLIPTIDQTNQFTIAAALIGSTLWAAHSRGQRSPWTYPILGGAAAMTAMYLTKNYDLMPLMSGVGFGASYLAESAVTRRGKSTPKVPTAHK